MYSLKEKKVIIKRKKMRFYEKFFYFLNAQFLDDKIFI